MHLLNYLHILSITLYVQTYSLYVCQILSVTNTIYQNSALLFSHKIDTNQLSSVRFRSVNCFSSIALFPLKEKLVTAHTPFSPLFINQVKRKKKCSEEIHKLMSSTTLRSTGILSGLSGRYLTPEYVGSNVNVLQRM